MNDLRTCRTCGHSYPKTKRFCQNKDCPAHKRAVAALKSRPARARSRRLAGRTLRCASAPGGVASQPIGVNASAAAGVGREAKGVEREAWSVECGETLADLVAESDALSAEQERWNAEHPGQSPLESPFAVRLLEITRLFEIEVSRV